jgi:hypothetical protein
MEQEVLRRAQRQLDLLPVFNQVCGSLHKLSWLTLQVKDVVISISTGLKSLSIDPSITNVVTQFSNAKYAICRAILDKCNLDIDAFKKFFFPGLKKVRIKFAKGNAETQKELEE